MSKLLQASLETLWLDILKPIGKVIGSILCSLPVLWLLVSTLGILPMTLMNSIIGSREQMPSWFPLNSYICLGVWGIILTGVIINLLVGRVQQRVKDIECVEVHKMYHATGQKCPCMLEKEERQKKQEEERSRMAAYPF